MLNAFAMTLEDMRLGDTNCLLARRHKKATAIEIDGQRIELPDEYMCGTSANVTDHRWVTVVHSPDPRFKPGDVLAVHELDEACLELPSDPMACKVPLSSIRGALDPFCAHNDFVFVEPNKTEQTTLGGIIIPSEITKYTTVGTVVAVGSKVKEDIVVGAQVAFDKFNGGHDFKVGAKTYRSLKETEIAMVFTYA